MTIRFYGEKILKKIQSSTQDKISELDKGQLDSPIHNNAKITSKEVYTNQTMINALNFSEGIFMTGWNQKKLKSVEGKDVC